MQLEKIVNVHKVLGDPNRMKMLMLLGAGEMNGQELAEKLNLSQPTITHHAAKLRETAVIRERRDKNNIYFSVNPEFLLQAHQASLDFIFGKKGGGSEMEEDQKEHAKMKETVLKNFFTKEGKLKQLPAQYKKKLIVLEHLAEQLIPGREYAEKELNEFIKTYHEDFATIRREFIMHEFMYRENSIYIVNPKEMWTKWEKVT